MTSRKKSANSLSSQSINAFDDREVSIGSDIDMSREYIRKVTLFSSDEETYHLYYGPERDL